MRERVNVLKQVNVEMGIEMLQIYYNSILTFLNSFKFLPKKKKRNSHASVKKEIDYIAYFTGFPNNL